MCFISLLRLSFLNSSPKFQFCFSMPDLFYCDTEPLNKPWMLSACQQNCMRRQMNEWKWICHFKNLILFQTLWQCHNLVLEHSRESWGEYIDRQTDHQVWDLSPETHFQEVIIKWSVLWKSHRDAMPILNPWLWSELRIFSVSWYMETLDRVESRTVPLQETGRIH